MPSAPGEKAKLTVVCAHSLPPRQPACCHTTALLAQRPHAAAPPPCLPALTTPLQELRELIARCWSPNPEDRPAFVTLVKELEVRRGGEGGCTPLREEGGGRTCGGAAIMTAVFAVGKAVLHSWTVGEVVGRGRRRGALLPPAVVSHFCRVGRPYCMHGSSPPPCCPATRPQGILARIPRTVMIKQDAGGGCCTVT